MKPANQEIDSMTTVAEQNATDLNAIAANGGITYTARKYGGAWVPVVIVNGKRHTFVHCSTIFGALEIAMHQAAKIADA